MDTVNKGADGSASKLYANKQVLDHQRLGQKMKFSTNVQKLNIAMLEIGKNDDAIYAVNTAIKNIASNNNITTAEINGLKTLDQTIKEIASENDATVKHTEGADKHVDALLDRNVEATTKTNNLLQVRLQGHGVDITTAKKIASLVKKIAAEALGIDKGGRSMS